MVYRFGIQSTPLLLLIPVLSLLLFFGFDLARGQVSPPSEGISREIRIGGLDYGFSRTINCHTHVLPVPESEDFTVFAVDGNGIQLVDLNGEGEVLSRRRLDLDLSKSSQIEASYMDEKTIGIFYMKSGTLYKACVDTAGGRFAESVFSRNIASFTTAAAGVVYQKEDGLYGSPADSGDENLLLPTERLLSFGLAKREDVFFILAVVQTEWNRVDIHLLRCDMSLRPLDDTVILEGGSLKVYQDLKDVYLKGNELTALYSYRNKQYKLNNLTLQSIALDRRSLKGEVQNDFPYYNSRYKIVEAGEEGIDFILQFDGRHSVDLGLCTINRNGFYELKPLTRTRNVSKLAGFINSEGYDVLVFTDLEYDNRVLLFASGSPRMIEKTTRLSSLSFFYPLVTTILIFLVSLVSGVLFLMAVMPLPFAASLVLDRFFRIRRAGVSALLTLAAAALHTGFQILITVNLLHGRIDTESFPLFAGNALFISMIITLVSLLSYALVRKERKDAEFESSSFMAFYVRFALYNYIVYVPLFLMYVFSAVVLKKI